MNGNQPRGVSHSGSPCMASGLRGLLFVAIGVVLFLSACAKRPEVVATTPPPTAGGPLSEGPGEQRPTQPGLRSSMPEPGTGSEAGGPTPGGRIGGPETEAMTGGPGTEGAAPEAGAAPSASLPPGTEMIAPPPSPPREEPVTQLAQLAPKESPLQDIFFDFDKAEIRPDAKAPLAADINWIKAHPLAATSIEGHCDERGTSEYNLGLGERRAKATKDYLVASGIDGKRIATVSYGKERPFVLGHDETAWRWNRRAHFVVMKE